MTTRLACVLLLTSLVACGGDDNNNTPMPDAPGSAAATITITGNAHQPLPAMALSGVAVSAFQNSDENTPVATATTDTSGNYTLTITTGGKALDGYIKATLAGHLDTYLYPPSAITTDYSGAALNIIDENTLMTLSGTFCHHAIDHTNGVVAVEVADASMTAVAGATVASTPAAAAYCYNGATAGVPDSAATMTATDGIGYMLDVSGDVTVSATKSGATFASHKVKARVGSLTTTLITP